MRMSAILCARHAAMMLEKILKAVMLKCGMDIERIYLINRLATDLKDILPVLSNLEKEISDMDYIYMPSRYPSTIIVDKSIALRQFNTANIIYNESMDFLNK